ncbi:hypothetical protein AAG906_006820 [Vitis piasezkii]
MHPPRMSAPSCIIPPLEQLVIRPHIVPFYQLSMEWRVRIHMPTSRSLRRYMEAINACPHHGFDTWLLVSYFYDGMSSSMKQILETMCGGDFMKRKEVSSQPTQNPKGGMYVLSEDMDMKAKVATIARRLEELELKKMHEGVHEVETQEGESSKLREVKAVITLRIPIKYKDPGCPTISVNIGGTHVEKALLDLGQV